MFGFDKSEDGSEDRYRDRVKSWTRPRVTSYAPRRAQPIRFARLRHHGWWLLHNCVAHLAIGIAPTRATFRFHDWTSRRLNGAR